MKQSGFTLVELLVVIAIIAAMAGVAVVAIPNPNPSKAISQEAQRFSDEFAIIQDRASAEQRVYGLVINSSGFEFKVVESWTEGNSVTLPEPVWEDAFDFEWREDVQISGAVTSALDSPTVLITPDGFYQPEFELTMSAPPRCSGVDFAIVGNGYNAPQVMFDEC
ncbi:prepilin-type N-terminal cleavage/methylation domain-containing protein [Salinibius halmophilus]|uniref:prepilin-type N-terminal cleavage/methylation domain-containing protein n=1 Tax=Salinibius halmophilus TaxID=1853216 RepID=UPI000E66A2B1|nr:prepilin-type N-terminal cleavage/methylation domain-containing protein [Salinibius halmophilus]